MKSLVVTIGLFVAALQAAPGERFPDDLTPMDVYMPVIEGAPEPMAPKIVGGQPAVPGQFPFQATLVISGTSFCAGVLICPTWVLTTAHCGNAGSTFQVILGRIQWQAPGGVVVVAVQRIAHPNYSSLTLANNIALLRIPPVTFTNLIRPVGLPPPNAGTFAGVNAIVSGFGRTTQTGGVSPVLMWVQVPVITNAVCAQTFGNIITPSTICTSTAAGRGTCNGDSGGPLVRRYPHCYQLIGIVSFGSSRGCAVGDPSGFVRITSFMPWIRSHTGPCYEICP